MPAELSSSIRAACRERDAVILAHYYQPPEIQAIADFVGDSLQLAQQAREAEAAVIVSCGVSFMAETAKILSPQKLVLNPVPEAGCPMADMVDVEGLRALRAQYPDAVVVSYVNTSAAVKAESDICCTSSNALNVIQSIPAEQRIIFTPDRNLGANIANQTGREFILWDGCCPIHDALSADTLRTMIEQHPQAKVVVHPECRPEVLALADLATSTFGLLSYVKENPEGEFIVGTEQGILHTISQQAPGARCYSAREDFICADMKKITLRNVADSLERLQQPVEIDENIRQQAYRALDRMLQI